MTLEAWVAVLAVLCVGLALGMVSTSVYAWQQWAELRREQVSREVERIQHERELEVLRQAVEQEHGASPARTKDGA